MKAMNAAPLDGFTRWAFPQDGSSHDVFSTGNQADPGVIVMHELPGMTPDCVDFAQRLSQQKFRVHLPLLFGQPLDDCFIKHGRALCVSREFACLKAGESAPITDWLRALARHLAPAAGGQRIGVIGMCLTGAFVIPLIIEPGVQAGVISQPAIPFSLAYRLFGLGGRPWKRQLNVSDQELMTAARCARESGKAVFLHDPPHALLTKEFTDHCADPQHVTKAAFTKVVAFLHRHLGSGASQPAPPAATRDEST